VSLLTLIDTRRLAAYTADLTRARAHVAVARVAVAAVAVARECRQCVTLGIDGGWQWLFDSGSGCLTVAVVI
jgi:hypothetical protein